MVKTLILPVKRQWFDLIKSGKKTEEYRLHNDYWRNRLTGKTFSKVIITLGYPKREDKERRIEFPWRGYRVTTIKSEEWDNEKKVVFAIKLHQITTGK